MLAKDKWNANGKFELCANLNDYKLDPNLISW